MSEQPKKNDRESQHQSREAEKKPPGWSGELPKTIESSVNREGKTIDPTASSARKIQTSKPTSDLDRVEGEQAKHDTDSPAYKALEGRKNKLLGEQKSNLKGDYGQRIRQIDRPGDFTPELKETQGQHQTPGEKSSGGPSDGPDPFAKLRQKYGSDNRSETPRSVSPEESGENPKI